MRGSLATAVLLVLILSNLPPYLSTPLTVAPPARASPLVPGNVATPAVASPASPSSGLVTAAPQSPVPTPASLSADTLHCLAVGRSTCGGILRLPVGGPAPAVANPNASWLNLTPSPLPSGYIDPRSGASMVYDPIDHEVLLFGGSSASDTWAWSHGAWLQIIAASACTPTTCPSPRSSAAFAWDAADQEAVLFGGLGGSGPLGDTWAFAHGSWTNLTGTAGTAPAPRWDASMTFDSGDNIVLLFGGAMANGTPYGDTWSFLGGHWTNLTPSLSLSPDPRWGAAIGNSPLGYVLMFGGLGATSLIQNNYLSTGGPYLAWWFHDGAWSPQTTPVLPWAPVGGLSGSGDVYGPCGRYDAALGWSPGNNRFVLFGGFGIVGNGTRCSSGSIFLFPLNDTWVYTAPLGGAFNMGVLGGWYNDTQAGAPTPRGDMAYAPDFTDNYFLIFGGNTGILGGFAVLNETWRYFEHVSVVFSGPASIEIGSVGFTNFYLYSHGGTGAYLYTSSTALLLNGRALSGCPGLEQAFPVAPPTDGIIACAPSSSSYNEFRTTVKVWDASNATDFATASWTFSVSPPETLQVYSQYSGYFYAGFHLSNIFGVYAEIDNQPVTSVVGTISGYLVTFSHSNSSNLWWNSSGVEMGNINPGSQLTVTASISDWNDTGSLPVKIIQTPDWLQQFTTLAQVVQTTTSSGTGPFGLKYTLKQDIPLPIGKLFNFSIPIPFITGNYSIVPDIHLSFKENSSGGVTLTGTLSFSTSKISFGVADLKLTLSLTVSGSFALHSQGGGATTIVWQSASFTIKLAGDFSISIPIYGFSFDLFGNTIKVGFNLDIDIDPSFAVTVFMVPTTNLSQEIISGINLMASDVWGEFSLPIDADLSFSIAIASVAVGGTLGVDANFEISPGPFQIANIWVNGSLYGKASFLFWSATWNVLGPGTIYHYLPTPLAPSSMVPPLSGGYDNGSTAVWAPQSRYYNTSGYETNVWDPSLSGGAAISHIYPSADPSAAAGFDGAYVFYTNDNVAAPVRDGLTISASRLDASTNALAPIAAPTDPGYLVANPEATTLADGSIYVLWEALPLSETSLASPADLTSVALHGASYSPANASWGPVRDWTSQGFAGSYRAGALADGGTVAALVTDAPLPKATTPEHLLTFNLTSGALESNVTVSGMASLTSLSAASGEAVLKDLGGTYSLVALASGTTVPVQAASSPSANLTEMEAVPGSASTLLLRYVNTTGEELVLYDPASASSPVLGRLPVGGDVRDAHALYNPTSGAYDVFALAPTGLQGWSVAGGAAANLSTTPTQGLHRFALVQSGGSVVAYGLASSGSTNQSIETLVLFEVPLGLPTVPGAPAPGTAESPTASTAPYLLYLLGAAVAVAVVLAVLVVLRRRGSGGGARPPPPPVSPPAGAVEPPTGGAGR